MSKATKRVGCGVAALATALGVYLAFFTPTKVAVRTRLGEADARSKAAIDERLKPVAKLFQDGRIGARKFAERSLSWSGKWNLVVGAFDGTSHRQFLNDAFEQHVFTPQAVQDAVESALRNYLTDVEGVEAEMLVKLRADLADSLGQDLPHFRDDAAFRREYRKAFDAVVAELRIELAVSVGKEVGFIVLTEAVTRMAVQAMRTAAAELGVSATILGSGTVSTLATLGVGLVVGFIIDAIVEEVFKLLGHDPVAKIHGVVNDSLDRMEESLTRRRSGLFTTTPAGSLRAEMERLHDERSKVRRETIARMLKGGGR